MFAFNRIKDGLQALDKKGPASSLYRQSEAGLLVFVTKLSFYLTTTFLPLIM